MPILFPITLFVFYCSVLLSSWEYDLGSSVAKVGSLGGGRRALTWRLFKEEVNEESDVSWIKLVHGLLDLFVLLTLGAMISGFS